MWFEQLTGFKESSSIDVRNKLKIEGNSFISTSNNRKFTFGTKVYVSFWGSHGNQ